MDFFDTSVDKGVTVTQVNTDTTAPTFAGIALATVISSFEIKLTWLDATDAVSLSPDIIYQVCYSTTTGACATTFSIKDTTAAGVLTKNYRIFQPNTTYYFMVRAVDEAGNVDTNVVELSATTPAANSWTTLTDMPTARFDLAVTAVSDYLFAIGGNDGVSDLDTVEIYSTLLDTWATASVLPVAASKLSACAASNLVYAFSGGNIYRYDPTTDTWVTRVATYTARTSMTCQTIGTQIYLIGGQIGATDQSMVELYDTALDSMNNCGGACTAMGLAASGRASAVYNSLVYVFGGDVGAGTTNTGEFFTPGGSGSWTAVQAAPLNIAGASAEAISQYVYIIGGSVTATANLAGTVLQYDTVNDSWKILGSQVYATTNHDSAMISNKIYVVGGKNSAGGAVAYLQKYQ